MDGFSNVGCPAERSNPESRIIHRTGSTIKAPRPVENCRGNSARHTVRRSGCFDGFRSSRRAGSLSERRRTRLPHLVEAMSEGAATLSRNGDLLYCNRRFAELMRRPPEKMIGIAVQSLVAETERDRFEAFLADGSEGGCERRIQPALRGMAVCFRFICRLTGFVDTRATRWAW